MISRRRFLRFSAGAAGLASGCGPIPPQAIPSRVRIQPPAFELDELTVTDLQTGMARGLWSSEQISALYLDRVEALDREGPALGAVVTINRAALDLARRFDAERRAGTTRGPLHGIPVMVKDNILTADPMATTCGSLALEHALLDRDAYLIARLREAGAVILAKANLSEWANFRSFSSTSGWSAVRGQCRNPYALDHNPCGSSSGSAVAVSANLAPLAVGTETDGSIMCPSAKNGVVGIKPTVGRVSRNGIIPISASQDTAGPIARTVADAAMLLMAMSGPDPSDAATTGPRPPGGDLTLDLDPNALEGTRLGIARSFTFAPAVWRHFESSLEALRDAGAVLIDPVEVPNADRLSEPEMTVLLHEFKAGIDAFLSALPVSVEVRSLADLIAFNEANVETEMAFFGQDIFRAAAVAGSLDDLAYRDALDRCRLYSRAEGIDAVMDRHQLDALVCPTGGLPWLTDYRTGDRFTGGSAQPAAVAGYPAVTVPMGLDSGLPLGISFFGRAWSERTLIRLAFAFERATGYREPPRFLPSTV